MASEPDQIRSDIARTRSELAQHVNRLADRTSPRRVMQRRWADARETAKGGADSFTHRLGEVSEQVRAAPGRVARQTEGRPWEAGLIAFGAGLIAAALLRETPAERGWSDRIAGAAAGVRAGGIFG